MQTRHSSETMRVRPLEQLELRRASGAARGSGVRGLAARAHAAAGVAERCTGRGGRGPGLINGAVAHAVGTGELCAADVEVVYEVGARVARGARAIACVLVLAIAAARTVDRPVGLALDQLRIDLDGDLLVRITRHVADGARAIHGGRCLAVLAAHAALEVIAQADARFALEGLALDVDFLRVVA